MRNSVYKRLVRPVLFRVGHGDPEAAHEFTLRALARAGAVPELLAPVRRWFSVAAPRTVFGVRFPNPVGLAAGMDKDGIALAGWAALGFGHVEVGTVTWHPQAGNPRPRLYRLPASGALINRMGFNNHGAQALAERLRQLGPQRVPIGISIGKSRITPVADAVDDYRSSLRVLHPYADYVAVNVSSPNTPGLRGLQDRALLDDLLAGLAAELAEAGATTPVLVKIAPDLTDDAIGDVLSVAAARGVAGVIATNTTVARDGIAAADQAVAGERGGLSGRPLAERALAVVAFVCRETGGTLPVIGVGGIGSPDDALRMLDAGASLVQLYTGFIYRGPGLVRSIGRAAARRAGSRG
ncbi:MAG TPA: quinone-dependent dihydroorotate dehydrogenase [Pseudonocardiaceae bacterium]